MIPGFFKRGVYAQRIRAMFSEASMVSLLSVDDALVTLSATNTIKALILEERGLAAVEYEAFGVLVAASTSGEWNVSVLAPDGTNLEGITVQMIAVGFGQTAMIPFYIKGRDESPQLAGAGYRLKCLERAGASTLNINAARLYGIR